MMSIAITMAMVATNILEVGSNTLVKAATNNGMSNFVYVAYSNSLAFFFLLSSTLLYHRKIAPPPISASVVYRLLLMSFLSCAGQILIYTGIELSSPTLSSAMVNLIPAFTFILSIVSRAEILDLRLRSCLAKVTGTVVSIAGALVVTFYKGLPIIFWVQPHKQQTRVLTSQHSNWLFGGFLLAAGSLCYSSIFVIQAWTLKDYPAEFMITTLCCGIVVIISTIVAFIAEGNTKAWILRPDIELVTIVYSAIFFISLKNLVCAWACHRRGAIYVAMFYPLGMVVAAIMGIIFLGDTLYLGSIIGCAIIAFGFYGVMWGLAHEEKAVNEMRKEICSYASSSEAPLLQNKSVDV